MAGSLSWGRPLGHPLTAPDLALYGFPQQLIQPPVTVDGLG
jgi:hypothetical protein